VFLRRPADAVSKNPICMATPEPMAPPPADIPEAIQAPADAPTRRPGSLSSPRPARAAPETPEVVRLPSRHEAPEAPVAARAPIPSGDFFAEAREGITDAFALEAWGGADEEEDDAAFQVTLPRSVIRQIRILAAQEGTTQRAIVLKALRLAGLAVPKGADIDRRILAGKRRQQA
jgi:hypothetical protein